MFIGNSIGGGFLLRKLYQDKVPFEKAIFLGFDPTPARRMQSISPHQIDIWVQLGVPEAIIRSMISPQALGGFGDEITEAFIAMKNDPRVTFIHGKKDETVNILEIEKYHPRNFIPIDGLEHNSVTDLDLALSEILSITFGISVTRLLNTGDLVGLQRDSDIAGIVPYFSRNRVGWMLFSQGSKNLNDLKFVNGAFALDSFVPDNYVEIANFNGKSFSINITKFMDQGYLFYPALCPMRSIYKDCAWVRKAHEINDLTQNSRVYSRNEKLQRSQLEVFQRDLFNNFHDLHEALIFMDEDNHLIRHLFEVQNTLMKLGLDEAKSNMYAIMHDIGKGIQIRIRQLSALKHDNSHANIRQIGPFRKFIIENDTKGLRDAIDRAQKDTDKAIDKYALTSNDLTSDRSISLRILLSMGYTIPQPIKEYLSGICNSLDSKLIRLADLISPYVSDQVMLDLPFIQNAVSLRLDSTAEIYGERKTDSSYLDEDVIQHVSKLSS